MNLDVLIVGAGGNGQSYFMQFLENLKKSDLYKQTIEVVSNRLKDFGLFISSDEIDSSTVVELIIIIAREEDKEFIKSGILP